MCKEVVATLKLSIYSTNFIFLQTKYFRGMVSNKGESWFRNYGRQTA